MVNFDGSAGSGWPAKIRRLGGTEGLPLKDYGGSDHIDPALLKDQERFHRIELGGRPMGLAIAKDSRTVYVANYLDNSVQVVDLAERKVVRALAGRSEPALAGPPGRGDLLRRPPQPRPVV